MSTISSREKAIWRAALTLSHNLLVERSNRLNREDGPLEVIQELSDQARNIAGWLEPTEQQLLEMFAEAGISEDPEKSQSCV